ncbi:MAG: hypothetical protein AAFX50_04375 [Acidobacteriota bacterium]
MPIVQGIFDGWGSKTGVNYVDEPNDGGSAWTSTTIAPALSTSGVRRPTQSV